MEWFSDAFVDISYIQLSEDESIVFYNSIYVLRCDENDTKLWESFHRIKRISNNKKNLFSHHKHGSARSK